LNALQIALALAVSMLIFSTLATMVVSMFHTILNSRRRGLKNMLGAFYDSEIKGRLNAVLETNGPIDGKQEFIDKITLDTGQAQIPADTSVTTIEFVRRLANTDIGKSIAKRIDTEIDVLIDEFADQGDKEGTLAAGALVDDPKAAFKKAARTHQLIERAAKGDNGFHGPRAIRV
jgi:hypothetical protein